MAKTKNKSEEKQTSTGGALLADVHQELRDQLEVVAARRRELQPGSFDRDLASAAASLGKAITGIEAERRLQGQASRRTLEDVPLEELLGFLRALPEDSQTRIVQELTGALGAEPLL